MNAHVRTVLAHGGSPARDGAMTVAHGVLDPERRELQALQRRARRRNIDAQRAIGAEPARPVEVICQRMDVAFVAVSAIADAPEDATCEPALEIGAIRELKRAGKGDPAFSRRDVAGAEPL